MKIFKFRIALLVVLSILFLPMSYVNAEDAADSVLPGGQDNAELLTESYPDIDPTTQETPPEAPNAIPEIPTNESTYAQESQQIAQKKEQKPFVRKSVEPIQARLPSSSTLSLHLLPDTPVPDAPIAPPAISPGTEIEIVQATTSESLPEVVSTIEEANHVPQEKPLETPGIPIENTSDTVPEVEQPATSTQEVQVSEESTVPEIEVAEPEPIFTKPEEIEEDIATPALPS